EWSTYLARGWAHTRLIYQAAKERGVRFRALTVRGADDVAVLGPLAGIWDIRIVDWHPVWLTMVDGRELYQAFTHPSLGGPPQFRQSSERNEIEFYGKVFDQLWARGQPL
ncbi:MAG: hypothetical protein QOC71_1704, partial [Thermoplasmata archaeon]|nr:hypothetical protein [Thermoplasmata archaeon]